MQNENLNRAEKLERLRSKPSSRDNEEGLLLACLKIIQAGADIRAAANLGAQDQREAHVFLFAGQAIASAWPNEGRKLQSAGLAWLAKHPGERISMSEFLGTNWAIGMPRFRDMLAKRIEFQKKPRPA